MNKDTLEDENMRASVRKVLQSETDCIEYLKNKDFFTTAPLCPRKGGNLCFKSMTIRNRKDKLVWGYPYWKCSVCRSFAFANDFSVIRSDGISHQQIDFTNILNLVWLWN